MSAYVIGDINVTDPETYAKYAAAVPDTSGPFGCRYLVRGPGKCENAEGDWRPERLVLAEYKDVETIKSWYYSPEYKELTKLRQSASTGSLVESLEQVKTWYNSPEYADLKKLRQSASKGNLIFADGA